MAIPPLVTIEVARKLCRQDKPFRVRLEQVDPDTNTGQWWGILGSGEGLCDVNRGRRGSLGLKKPHRKFTGESFTRAQRLLSEGYSYTSDVLQTMPKTTPPAPALPLTGLLLEIRSLYQIASDHYQAFDEDGNLLMDVNAETAQRIHDADSFRISMTTL